MPTVTVGVPPAIVPRGNGIRTQLMRRLPEQVEFDFPVAQDVGIGCAPGGIFREHVVYDALPVSVGEIDDLERNAEVLRDEQGIIGIVHPWAGIVQGDGVIDPIAHEESDDLMPLLLQEMGGDTAVHTTGKSDHDAHGAKLQLPEGEW